MRQLQDRWFGLVGKGRNAFMFVQFRAGRGRQQIDMIWAIDAGGLKPMIDKGFPLEEIVAAFKHQESNRHFGKICLEI